MADFGGDVEAFRAEARTWLDANFPKALAKDPMAQLAKLQARPESPEARAWRLALGAKGWGGDGFSEVEVQAMRSMLRSKANSIEGGTSEINLNIVAKRVLGLPDPKKGG